LSGLIYVFIVLYDALFIGIILLRFVAYFEEKKIRSLNI
ncbi:hypothetical protein, partial [Staphylococcus pseudintermedius]